MIEAAGLEPGIMGERHAKNVCGIGLWIRRSLDLEIVV
jgi:hypothetical protein